MQFVSLLNSSGRQGAANTSPLFDPQKLDFSMAVTYRKKQTKLKGLDKGWTRNPGVVLTLHFYQRQKLQVAPNGFSETTALWRHSSHFCTIWYLSVAAFGLRNRYGYNSSFVTLTGKNKAIASFSSPAKMGVDTFCFSSVPVVCASGCTSYISEELYFKA